MKLSRLLGVLLALLGISGYLGVRASVLSGAASSPLDPFVLNFDENGNGQLSINGGAFADHPGGLSLDPTRSGLYSLTYTLPGVVNNGDIRIWEDASMTVLSDVIRFTDANGNLVGTTADRMIYYSDPGDSDLADVNGIPDVLMPNDSGGVVEQGNLEVYDYFTWAPGGAADNIYNGISDIPEPSTMVLVGLSLSGLLLIRRKV